MKFIRIDGDDASEKRARIKIRNLDKKIKNGSIIKRRRHGDLLPNSIRATIVGPSNVRKTELMINLVINPNGLNFQNLYIYSKSLNQEKYQYLTKIMSKLQKTDNIGYYTFANNVNVIPLSKAEEN